MDTLELIGRVEASASLVDPAEQARAHRVVELARQLQGRPRSNGMTVPGDGDAQLRRELNQHFELLGRRGAKALPAAALARALLAELGGTRQDVREALEDCNLKLLMFGL